MRAIIATMMLVGLTTSMAEGGPRGHHPRHHHHRPRVGIPVRRGPVVVRPSPVVATVRAAAYLLAPPRNHVVVVVGGHTYYRDGSVFYRPAIVEGRKVYVQTAPPVGTVITTLPDTPEEVVVNGEVYYRASSTFYRAEPSPSVEVPQYKVVRPPVGSFVEELPDGATKQTRDDGSAVYIAEGVEYLPVQVAGKSQYVVVR
ncbi:hypothetical protein Pan216_18430 [Planctomycetes bacterium Pan216]|uniref:Uncharacterized protein n=1 Tax=Kolteria novifilia TaxID=2527975 RepID=A0A518B1X8_9BACT|nr:hypothetical protein Pan216_18430 [Planctomycetes bacterium Pan216]